MEEKTYRIRKLKKSDFRADWKDDSFFLRFLEGEFEIFRSKNSSGDNPGYIALYHYNPRYILASEELYLGSSLDYAIEACEKYRVERLEKDYLEIANSN